MAFEVIDGFEMKELEQQLIWKIQSGDRLAFELLFKTYYKSLVYIADSILQDWVSAEEVVQDVFVKLWKSRNNILIDRSLYSYLVIMTRNRSIDYIRDKERKIKTLSLDDEDIRIKLLNLESALSIEEEYSVQTMENERLKQALEQLPLQCRQIFLLSRIEEYSYSEIAKKMQISISTVKTQMSRALQKLRDTLTGTNS